MNRMISIFAVTISTLAVALSLPAFAQTAASQEYVEPATVPAAIALHAGQVTVIRVHAAGYQVYTCGMANGAAAWTLAGPDANLFDAKQTQVGTHFSSSGAPAWRLNDGSEITGKKVAAAPSPDATAVAWLLLSVVSHGSKTGVLAEVTTIQRVNTVGGVAPTTGCDATNQGRVAKSPYSADYFFSK